MKKIIWIFSLGFLLRSSLGFSQEMERKEVSLTVYNQNFALVRDLRSLDLKNGVNQIRFTDVASQIDATSVHFESLTDPSGCSVLEQNYEYDLISREKLLGKYIDKKIKVGGIESTLLSTLGGMTVKIGDEIHLNPDGNIVLPSLPEGLITKPTLMWQVESEKTGKNLVELSYLTNGLNWQADYVAGVAKDEKSISLNGWVTLNNRSGATYEDAGLKLIAGDVHRVTEKPVYNGALMERAEVKTMAGAPQFEEKPFFEYHLYTLQRKTTLKDNQTKQVALLTAPKVLVEKTFTYDGAIYHWYYYDDWRKQTCNKKIAVNLEFKNSEKNGLGIPLPKGKVRVYKADTDETLQFIGEDRIDHTPKDEKMILFLGDAFDIVGERKITDHKMVASNLYRDTYEITLRNHKKEPATIKVIEHQWGDWEIISASQKYDKKDAFTIQFDVPVEKDGEARITYTAEYKF